MRLDKMLAHSGFGSRKQVKEVIKKGNVSVNGKIITSDKFQVNETNDEVYVNEQKLVYQKYVYLMLNKPSGYISATFDNVHQTVLDILSGYEHFELFPVGRLDIDTEGLLLLTNDGNLAHHILSPKKHISKIYYAVIEGVVDHNDQEAFKSGINLGDFTTLSSNLKILNVQNSQTEVEIEIFEGKFHQIKRMFEARNKKVVYLKRLKMKNLVLDPNLKIGEYRELTDLELNELKKI